MMKAFATDEQPKKRNFRFKAYQIQQIILNIF